MAGIWLNLKLSSKIQRKLNKGLYCNKCNWELKLTQFICFECYLDREKFYELNNITQDELGETRVLSSSMPKYEIYFCEKCTLKNIGNFIKYHSNYFWREMCHGHHSLLQVNIGTNNEHLSHILFNVKTKVDKIYFDSENVEGLELQKSTTVIKKSNLFESALNHKFSFQLVFKIMYIRILWLLFSIN